jgi:tetratricopeptide (TPR) repeat protein
MKKISGSIWAIPAALLGLCAIAYGPMITKLGLYWDDWPSLWFLHFYGPRVFPQAFAIDRPIQGWLFVLSTSLIGEKLLAWHVFGIITRWISGLALYWVLYSLWPNRKIQVVWITILFLVYPGFGQQYIPITYGHQLIILSLYLTSFGTMIWSLQAESLHRLARYVMLTGLSLLTSVLSMFALEYFFGLELLRPVFIWMLADRFMPTSESISIRRRLSYTLKHWLPYALADGLFLAWRVTHTTPRGSIIVFDNLISHPLVTLANLIGTIVQDLIEVAVQSWAQAFSYLNPTRIKPDIQVTYWLVVLSGFFLLIIFLRYLQNKQPGDPSQRSSTTDAPTNGAREQRKWGLQTSVLGLYALLIAGWPIWVTDLHLELTFPWDRFTLLFMLGVSLLLVGLFELLIRPSWLKIVLVSLIAGLSMGAQLINASYYRLEWQAQKDFFWQLAWRAPGIEQGTTLLTSELPFTYSSDNSLTAPLNWIYAPENPRREMPYVLYDIEARLGLDGVNIGSSMPIQIDYRATGFEGSTNQAFVVFYDPPRCVKVVDPAVDRFLPVRPLYIREATTLSKLDLILTNPSYPAVPTELIFGPEPPHKWCYYFEKAELYGQMGEWQKAAEAADKALEITKHFTDKNVSELLPFIEAYAHTEEWNKAVDYSLQAFRFWDRMQYPLCDVWLRILATTPPSEERTMAIDDIQDRLKCRFP